MTTDNPKPTNEAPAGQSLAASALFDDLFAILEPETLNIEVRVIDGRWSVAVMFGPLVNSEARANTLSKALVMAVKRIRPSVRRERTIRIKLREQDLVEEYDSLTKAIDVFVSSNAQGEPPPPGRARGSERNL